MKDLQREILNQVASGTISATEAAARIEALEAQTAVVELAPPPPPPAAPPVVGRTVQVLTQLGTTEIVGDPSVDFVVAEGPHVARQEGDTMVIDHSPLKGSNSFRFGGRQDDHRDSLVVRMNPDLDLVARIRAGNARIEGIHGAISAEVQAGECKIRDFRGPLNLVVQAGDVTATGRLDKGASKVRCQMGEAKLTLEQGSSVRINAHSTMGDVTFDGEHGTARTGNQVVLGAGAATLDVECTMGSIKVTAE